MAEQGGGGVAERVRSLLERRKYEFLLAALLQHLFAPIFLADLDLYTRFSWPVNMVLLGLFSVGIFAGRSRARRIVKNTMSLVVVAFPVLWGLVRPSAAVMVALSLSYVAFFLVILVEVRACGSPRRSSGTWSRCA